MLDILSNTNNSNSINMIVYAMIFNSLASKIFSLLGILVGLIYDVISLNIDIESSSVDYSYIKECLFEKSFCLPKPNIIFKDDKMDTIHMIDSKKYYMIIPFVGFFKPCIFSIKKNPPNPPHPFEKRDYTKYTYNLVILFGTKKNEKTLMKIIEEYSRNKIKTQAQYNLEVYNRNRYGDNTSSKLQGRDINSIFIKDNTIKSIINEIKEFYNTQLWYRKHGITPKKIILLDGPPGTGKTSLIKALAIYFNKSLYCVPTDLGVFSEKLNLVNTFKGNFLEKTILFIDDIERVFGDEIIQTKLENRNQNLYREAFSKDEVFKNLLSFFDGNFFNYPSLMIITTNDKSKLNPVMTREGRVDSIYQIGYIDQESAKKMFLSFFPEEKNLAENFSYKFKKEHKIKTSTIESIIIKYKNDPIKVSKWNFK